MDRLIYIAMTGAKHTMWQQDVIAHNLANASTPGFRAQLSAFRALPVYGEGSPTRAFVVNSTIGTDFTPGVVQQTGRDLDVAVQGKGWIAVQTTNGKEGYTRDGSLQIGANGLLQTRSGLNVLGDGGTISIPPDTDITIATDGTISTVPTGQTPNSVIVVGRIKLVNPPEKDLVRGDNGLFSLTNGQPAEADANVMVAPGSLEGSNASVVEALTNMITQSRQFEMQMKLIQNADGNARQAAQLLNMNA